MHKMSATALITIAVYTIEAFAPSEGGLVASTDVDVLTITLLDANRY